MKEIEDDYHPVIEGKDSDYKPQYFISENGVGYMPTSEIIKTKAFKDQMKALKTMSDFKV